MCGIIGYIGKSSNPKLTSELTENLLKRTEIRGPHATGFWAVHNSSQKILYHKEPEKASVFVHNKWWGKAKKFHSSLFIGHCRFSSPSAGHEKHNKNNHPFTSEDYSVALVHNGKIPEYSALKNRYDLTTDCDSELLLRMFQTSDAFEDSHAHLQKRFPNLDPEFAYRLLGLHDIFSKVNYGAMACAIGESADFKRRIWLFRDDARPLHVVDMQSTLGQIFFCSTPEIWRLAIDDSPGIKKIIPQDQPIFELPAMQIWTIHTNRDGSLTTDGSLNLKKFKVNKTKPYKDLKQEPEKQKSVKVVKKKKNTPMVITGLGKDLEPIKQSYVKGHGENCTCNMCVSEKNNSRKCAHSPDCVCEDCKKKVDVSRVYPETTYPIMGKYDTKYPFNRVGDGEDEKNRLKSIFDDIDKDFPTESWSPQVKDTITSEDRSTLDDVMEDLEKIVSCLRKIIPSDPSKFHEFKQEMVNISSELEATKMLFEDDEVVLGS